MLYRVAAKVRSCMWRTKRRSQFMAPPLAASFGVRIGYLLFFLHPCHLEEWTLSLASVGFSSQFSSRCSRAELGNYSPPAKSIPLLAQPHPFRYVLSMVALAAFLLPWHSCSRDWLAHRAENIADLPHLQDKLANPWARGRWRLKMPLPLRATQAKPSVRLVVWILIKTFAKLLQMELAIFQWCG